MDRLNIKTQAEISETNDLATSRLYDELVRVQTTVQKDLEKL